MLEPGKAALLEALSAGTGIPKQALLREAVDDLLQKHAGRIAPAVVGDAGNVVKFKTRGMLEADRFFNGIAQSLGLESFEQLERQVKIHKEAQRAARKKSKPKK